jgi:tagatose-1,6-bisphosphate aldolase
MTPSVGKRRRLAALADYEGRFQIVDARGAGGFAPCVAGVLSAQASAVLLDPRDAMPAAALELDRGAGLVFTLGDGALIDGWSVAKAARAGACAVHLRLAWQGDTPPGLLDMVGDEAAKHELPLLLEPVVPDHGWTAALNAMAADDMQVDLLALPYAATVALHDVGTTCQLPWLTVGSGDDAEAWLTEIRLAALAGAGGFVCGGLTWRAAVGTDSPEEWLHSEGVYRLRRAVATSERAVPWSAPEAEIDEGWLLGY